VPQRKLVQNTERRRVYFGNLLEEYNCERPHRSLDYRTPDEFAKPLEGRGARAPLSSQTTTINTTEDLQL
jgi:hypothetical protein